MMRQNLRSNTETKQKKKKKKNKKKKNQISNWESLVDYNIKFSLHWWCCISTTPWHPSKLFLCLCSYGKSLPMYGLYCQRSENILSDKMKTCNSIPFNLFFPQNTWIWLFFNLFHPKHSNGLRPSGKPFQWLHFLRSANMFTVASPPPSWLASPSTYVEVVRGCV